MYDMAWRAWHGIWYYLARYGMVYGVVWRNEMYMEWPGPHDMVYGIAWRALQDIWYGLAGMAWYMVLPGEVWDGLRCGLAG